MIGKIATAIALTMVATMPASAQNGQFVPVLSFRTGPYGGTGAPWANGVIDYYNLVNVRDGGINGVKLLIEECETGFATDKGVECYERLKGKGPTGAAFVNPISTGITYALTEKAPTDKIPIITMGYGRGELEERRRFHLELSTAGNVLDGCRHHDPAHREGTGRGGQSHRKEDQPYLSR